MTDVTTTSLPDGRYFTLAWTIPDQFGGLTSAMLHRSRAFATRGGVSVTVLTFDDRVDYPAIEHRLRERGELAGAMRIVNLWDWLRDHSVPPAKTPLGSRAFTPLTPDPAYRSAYRDGNELRRIRLASDRKTVLQTDYYRADGSLLVSHRQDAVER